MEAKIGDVRKDGIEESVRAGQRPVFHLRVASVRRVAFARVMNLDLVYSEDRQVEVALEDTYKGKAAIWRRMGTGRRGFFLLFLGQARPGSDECHR